MKAKIKVLIATIHSEGGVSSMLRFVCNSFDHNVCDVHIVRNTASHSELQNLSTADLLKARWKVGVKRSLWEGLEAFSVGRRFSYIEPLHYIGNLEEWIQLARGYDVHIVVSGFNSCGLAFAKGDCKFISWIATTIDDDKEGRKQSWPKVRQWADTFWSPRLRKDEFRILQKCSKNLVISNYTASLITNRYGSCFPRSVVMPYPINADWFCPAERPNGLNIISVGRWDDPRKNIDMLLRMFAIVNRAIPKSKLILVGHIPDHLSEIIKENGIDREALLIVGPVSNIETRDFYQKGALFALSSHQEGLAIVGLEAMACGLPVVATRCGGPEDYVLEGVNGYIVPKDDHKAMAEKSIALLQDTCLRKNISINARKYVLRHYSIPVVSPIFAETLAEVWPEFFC